ncbi:protein-methionine-sulfoxide reductase heme-binding subunit MsrQ [Kordiimonas aestuarii]|uniref:sulfite oxidase heme-binding subunit YedZ n=1 Tax=Kordiimonas aestuarii TaxID=1005925 RepID=UPI0021D0A3D2|nr:protein-methionine-sulfoxide reductase heme-binding subunit MsrQ [Kordiimonas aestuarii]
MVLPTRVWRFGIKPVVFAVALIPAAWLAYEWWLAFQGQPHDLGFNPNETSNRFSGDWALRMLLITLALTPLTKILKSPKPILFRRMFGLFAYFYVCLHMLSYIWLDMLFNWPELWADVLKRIYITIGMTAFLMLTPLAITSTKGMVKRLGAKHWQRLHKLIYLIAPLAIIHFFMMRKGFQLEPLVYGAILAVLLLLRLMPGRRKKLAKA